MRETSSGNRGGSSPKINYFKCWSRIWNTQPLCGEERIQTVSYNLIINSEFIQKIGCWEVFKKEQL